MKFLTAKNAKINSFIYSIPCDLCGKNVLHIKRVQND